MLLKPSKVFCCHPYIQISNHFSKFWMPHFAPFGWLTSPFHFLKSPFLAIWTLSTNVNFQRILCSFIFFRHRILLQLNVHLIILFENTYQTQRMSGEMVQDRTSKKVRKKTTRRTFVHFPSLASGGPNLSKKARPSSEMALLLKLQCSNDIIFARPSGISTILFALA